MTAGMTGRQNKWRGWTYDDEWMVRAWFPVASREELVGLLDRSWSAIQSRAFDLGVARPRDLTSEAGKLARQENGRYRRGYQHTDEAKRRIGEASKNRLRTTETCERISQGLLNSPKHANLATQKGRQWSDDRRKGREAALHQSAQMATDHIQPRTAPYVGQNGTIMMRSFWEVAYAYMLDAQNVAWEYEPTWFALPDGRRYMPDFRIAPNHFVEVKSAWSKKNEQTIKKIELLRSVRPDVRVDVVDEFIHPTLQKSASILWRKHNRTKKKV